MDTSFYHYLLQFIQRNAKHVSTRRQLQLTLIGAEEVLSGVQLGQTVTGLIELKVDPNVQGRFSNV
jgi:hypothetical protein